MSYMTQVIMKEENKNMNQINTRKLVYTALCITLGLILPQVNKLAPGMNLGTIILPMHLPVLLAGFLCGIPYAAFTGAILPLLSLAFNGFPIFYPVGISMMFELGSYGVITAILYQYTKGKVYPSLIGAMIGGRIVMGVVNGILYAMVGWEYGIKLFLTAAFVTALPGIILQLIIIPTILYSLKKARLLPSMA